MTRMNLIRRTVALGAVALMATLVGCGSGSPSAPDMVGAPAVQPDMAAGGGDVVQGVPEKGGESPSEDGGPMVIVNKTIRLEVTSTKEAVEKIREIVAARDGSVSDMQVSSDDGWVYPADGSGFDIPLRGWLIVRVPTATYEPFVADVGGLGKVTFQSESISDVTQQHIDMSARLANLRAQEVRLREFFDQAKNVEEMLAIETELGRVRGEIESLDAQVVYLERQAARVTVTIQLTEPAAVVSPGGQSWGFTEAITNGLRGAVALMNGVLTFLIATAPVWAVALVVFFPVRAWLRRRRQPTTTAQPEVSEASPGSPTT